MKTVEILQYILRKGTGATFHAIMQDISVPLHQQHGIDVVSFGNSLHDPDCYYLMRAFDNPESMATVLDSFYASADWRNGPREEIIHSIETSLKTVINLPLESVDGLRVQYRRSSSSPDILSVAKF
ncbi:NIPSNAP family containing protein [Raoultella terrigena]|uniref:NIPSNAP family containing protein n=1 Tax=Raoultella terrigena TaxID=577 RepID=UPI0005F84EB3|nr:NIPSNAP family containing protein [Raoultella terrigena]